MHLHAITPQWLSEPHDSKNKRTRFGEAPLFKEGLYQIGTHTYAWMVPNGSWGETNLGLIQGKNESALIDTCWDLKYTQEMLNAVKHVIDKAPIEYVINTHADGDHCWGNQLFAGKQIIGTQACAHQMHHISPKSLMALKVAGRVLRRIKGTPIDAFGHYMSSMFAPYDFRNIQITPPSNLFKSSRSLNVGGVELILHEVGPGHTDGDAIVHVPEQEVVYSGDILFVNATPVLWAGPLDHLLKALDTLSACNARVIVPGHGFLATQHHVDLVKSYWLYLQENLYKYYVQDIPPYEAARNVALSADFQLQPFAQWDSPERIVTNAYTLYRHWGAKLLSLPHKLSVMDIMRQQANLAIILPKASPAVMHNM